VFFLLFLSPLSFIHSITHANDNNNNEKDSISTQSDNSESMNLEDSYANLLKDADKLKLMLLAWNYQNSAAVRNGNAGPDLATMTNLWEQYQNALGMSVGNNKPSAATSPVSVLLILNLLIAN